MVYFILTNDFDGKIWDYADDVRMLFHFPSAQKHCFLLKALLYKLEEIADKTPEMGSGLED